MNEAPIDLANHVNLFGRARCQDDPIGLEALLFAAAEDRFDVAVLIDQCPTQAEASGTALSITLFDEPPLAGEDLYRKLPAVFASHGALEALEHGAHRRPVILELFGAIGDLNSGAAADVLVVGALIGVLETAPAADIINQDHLEIGGAGFDVGNQPLQRSATVDR